MPFNTAGLMNHSRVTPSDWEGRYRCFAYQSIYDGFLLAQSGEAKCNLYSAKEGDRTMTLKKGEWEINASVRKRKNVFVF